MKSVRLERCENGIEAVVIDRPQRRNACDPSTWQALGDAFAQAAQSTDTRALILTGAGGHFCAGDDVAALAQLSGDAAGLKARMDAIRDCFSQLRAVPFPVIAAIQGVCIGTGCALATYCDFRAADRSARIGIIVARQSTAYLSAHLVPLVSLIGLAGARRWLYGGEIHGAEAAAAAGFVDYLVDKDPMAEALRIARTLLDKAPLSLAVSRAQLDAMAHGDLGENLERIDALAQSVRGSLDRQEAISAFLQKRKPIFVGR